MPPRKPPQRRASLHNREASSLACSRCFSPIFPFPIRIAPPPGQCQASHDGCKIRKTTLAREHWLATGQSAPRCPRNDRIHGNCPTPDAIRFPGQAMHYRMGSPRKKAGGLRAKSAFSASVCTFGKRVVSGVKQTPGQLKTACAHGCGGEQPPNDSRVLGAPANPKRKSVFRGPILRTREIRRDRVLIRTRVS